MKFIKGEFIKFKHKRFSDNIWIVSIIEIDYSKNKAIFKILSSPKNRELDNKYEAFLNFDKCWDIKVLTADEVMVEVL